jgi:hypothetical protein
MIPILYISTRLSCEAAYVLGRSLDLHAFLSASKIALADSKTYNISVLVHQISVVL